MTMRLGPPYFGVRPQKIDSPRWHRLRSTRWFIASIPLTGVLITFLALDVRGLALLAAVLIEIVVLLTALNNASWEISQHRNPAPSITNLILCLVVNPGVGVVILLRLGILDFG